MNKAVLVLSRTFLLGLLLLVAGMSAILPAQAPKPPSDDRGVRRHCFAVVGIDLNGKSHEATFYFSQKANKQAAAWLAAGWTGVMISAC